MSLAELFYRKHPRPSFWSRLRSRKPSRVSHISSLVSDSALSTQQHPARPRCCSSQRAVLSTQRFFFEALEPRLLLSSSPFLTAAPEGLKTSEAGPPASAEIVTQGGEVAPSQQGGGSSALFSLDIDGNQVTEAATDGKLLILYLADVPDGQLETAVGLGAQRDTAVELRAYLDPFRAAASSPFDADGNGVLEAFTDGRLFYRFLSNVSDEQLLSGAVLGAGATRPMATSITSFLTPFHPDRELTPPVVIAGLQVDTGLSTTDGVSTLPAVSGTVDDLNAVTVLRARLDALPISTILPTVEILSPGESGLVALGTVAIQFQVRNYSLGGEGEAHLHIYVDADPTPYQFFNGTTQEVLYQGVHTHFMHWSAPDSIELHGLQAGSHQLRFVLADGADQTLTNPEAIDTVTFSVATPPSGEFQLQSMLGSLNFPVAMAFAPDGRLFYNELATGRVRVVSPQWALQATPVHTFQIVTGGEQGLLGIAVDPDFTTNHFLYVYHTVSGSPVRNQVVRITEANGIGSSPTVIIPNLPGNSFHIGGNLHFGSDGKLYVTIGDAGVTENSQNPASLAGKILRYNKDGSIPVDNPVSGSPIYASGLRNSFDFTFHSDTDDLWATENGVSMDDEVNRIVAGGNYGWPIVTGITGAAGFRDPIIEFTPPPAPTGIVSISDQSAYPEPYHHNLFFADYNFGQIHRLALAGSGLTALAGHSIIYPGGQGGLLDLVEGPDGFVYVSSGNGIFRLMPSTTVPFQITDVTATGISEATAMISWSTSVPADTQVEYGLTTAYGLASPLAPALVSSHTIDLTGLMPGMTYHFRVTSRDRFGRPEASADHTFMTPQFAVLPNSVDVLSDLAQHGTFLLTEARLETLFGTLADGPYTLRLQAEDSRGNARFSDLFFALDTTPPGEPLPDLVTASDSGLSGGDDVTGEARPIIRLTSESGRLRILLDGIMLLQADTGGTFNFTPASPLADGIHEITATVEDAAGNMSLLSVPLSITVDTAPPAPPTWDLAPASDTEMPGDQKTTEVLVTLEGRAEPGAFVTLVELAQSTTAGPTGDFSVSAVQLIAGANPFTIRVTDLAGNVSELARTVTRMAPPELGAIGDQTRDEGEQFQFTATATDLDSPLSGLTYSLADGAMGSVPAGASIAPSTGVFSWTPTEAQGPGTYTFDVVVTDSGTPALSDRETITVAVNEVNNVPVLNPIGNQTVDKGQTVSLTAGATDSDDPANTLAFSLEAGATGQVPAGATIDPVTGLFTWATTEPDGPGIYTFDVVVTDNGDPALSDHETITITVLDVPAPAPAASRMELVPQADTAAPVITAQLAADSGFSNSDRLTNDPTITGMVADASAILFFHAGFDAMPVGQYAEVSSRLMSNGSFMFDPDYLDIISIVPLAEGPHTLHLLATDSEGNVGSLDLSFTLDTTPPPAPALDLLASSDSGVSGNDNITGDTTPTLAVTREAEAAARVFSNGLLLATLPAGTLTATLGPLAPGAYAFQGVTVDAAGNQSALSISLGVTIDPIPPEEPGFDLAPAFAVEPPKVARTVVASIDGPQIIPDRGGLLSSAMVQGLSGTLFDLNVQLDLVHGSLQDLEVTLVSPSGTAINLFVSLSGTTMSGTVFDDSAPANIAVGASPFIGRYRPAEPLTFFDGENPNGLWMLAITDAVAGFSGVLNGWSLILRTSTDVPSPANITPVTIQGWTDPSTRVRLLETGAVATSAPDGSFSFSSLSVAATPARYTVEASDVAGNVSVFARDLILRNERAALQGVKFEDQDGDGLRDPGEPGLAGWTIELEGYDQPAPGATTLPPVRMQLAASTGADGRFIFADLDPGIYVLREVLQPGWTQLAPAGTALHPAPLLSGAPWLPNPLPAGAHLVQVGAFEIVSGLDFGNARFGSIAGVQFHDLDADGVIDPGEPGLAGWTIYLDANNNGSRDVGERTTVTDAQGVYRLDDLKPGAYVVREEVPVGWRQTTPGSGGYNLALTGGQVVTDRNFGTVQLGSLRGEQFEDVDGDGTHDVGEPVLAGWTLYLDTNGNGRRDAGEPVTVTDAEGVYAFPDLLPGSYRVAEEVPSGWVQTFPRLQPPGPTVGPAGLGLMHIDAVGATLVLPDEVLLADTGLSLEAAGPADILTHLDGVLADPRFADLDGHGMTIAVIDTGIDVDHPFFGPDLDGNGVDDRIIAQFDFADQDADAGDHNGHGSTIASIIGSQDTMFRGVAPGVNLIMLKVFKDSGLGDFSYLEQALQWVVDNADAYSIDVVNMSLGDGGNWTDPIGRYGVGDELAVVAAKGILVMAAAGNNFFSVGSAQGLAYPAADPNVIAAGAVWSADFGGPFTFGSGARDVTTGPDRIASFSQRHETLLDILAPGARFTGANQNGGTTTLQGTSQASAYLSGVAVLAQQLAEAQVGRRLSPSEFVNLIRTTGDLIVDGDDENDNVINTGLTFPRVDMQALAEAILNVTGPGPGPDHGEGGGQPAVGMLVTHTVTLIPGQHLTDLDFGNFRLGEIRGLAFHDANVDGLLSPGESVLSGWTVYLDDNRNGAKDPAERSTMTDNTGAYRFADVGPGRYVVQEEAQSHWGRTVNAAGSPELVMTSGASVSVEFGNVLITLDVDGDGSVSAFTDGRLLSRTLAGVSDSQLTAGSVMGATAVRNSASAIRAYLALAESLPTSMLDADGNGSIQSATDGKLILRYMAGMPDTQLIIGGAIGLNATNLSAASIRSFLDSFQPPAPSSALSAEPSAISHQLSAQSPEPQTSNLAPQGVMISSQPSATRYQRLALSADVPAAVVPAQAEMNNGGNMFLTADGPKPDLGPFPLFGGIDPIVVSTQPGTNSDSVLFTELDNVFIDWAIDNHGEVPTESPFTIEVLVDGQIVAGYLVDFPLDLETALYDEDIFVGRLSAGVHEVQLVVDTTNAIDELNESDNVFANLIGVAPSNDDRSRAITIGNGAEVARTDTRFATSAADDPQPSCRTGLDGHSVWYRYVADADGLLTVDTTGSTYNTVLSLYTNLLQELACNDNASATQTDSQVQLNVEQGRTYLIQVASFGDTPGGTLVLNAAFEAGRPNLEFVQPAGWSNKIVVSLEPGTNTDSPILTFGDRPYVDFAVINSGNVSLAGSFVVTLNFQQGVQRFNVSRDTPLAPGEVFIVEDIQLGPIPSGFTQFEVVADSFFTISESNEDDNITARQVEVNFIPGAIHGQVYRDRNADGFQNVGDDVLSGWTVYLDQDGTPGLSQGDSVTTTDQGGAFEFVGLRPGIYGVGEVLPAGWLSTNMISPGFAGVTVFDAQTSSVSLGNVKRNELGGQVFFDLNSNGVRDPGEPAAAGIRIYADLDHDGEFTVVGRVSGEPFVETNADGTYDFYAGPFGFGFRTLFGSYSVRVDTSNGIGVTMPGSGGAYPVAISGDDTVITGLNFGIIQVNEAPIANQDEVLLVEDTGPFVVTGNLLANDVDPDNRFQPLSLVPTMFGVSIVGVLRETSFGTLIMQANGEFTYTLDTAKPQSLRQGAVGHDDRPYWISDGQLISMGMLRVTITGANDAPTIISGGGGDTATVAVPENDTGVIQMNTADVDVGDSPSYAIVGGADQAKFTIDPVFRDLMFLDAPDFENPTDSNQDNIYEIIVQVSDGHPGGIDAQQIFVQVTDVSGTGYIGGRHFEDVNGDGVWQGNEPVLASRTVYLDLNASGIMDATEPRTLTDTSGQYFFGNLQAGIYQVVVPQQAGWMSTTPPGLSQLSTGRSVIVREGRVSEGADLGTFKLGEIRGTVFNDVNADRVKQAGEAGLQGWTVYLDANANGVRDPGETATVTDGTGAYVFTNIGPGPHHVREVLQPQWGATSPLGSAHDIVMTSGIEAAGRDFGVLFITLDVDGDGTMNPFTDGRLITRYLSGDADTQLLVETVIGPNAIRNTAGPVRAFLDAAKLTMLDVDGDRQYETGTDGRLLARYMVGLSDDQLMSGDVIGVGATRRTAPEIRDFLSRYLPAPAAQLSSQGTEVGGLRLEVGGDGVQEPTSDLQPRTSSLSPQSSVLGANISPVTGNTSRISDGSAFSVQTSASSPRPELGTKAVEPRSALTVPMGFASSLTVQPATLGDGSDDRPLVSDSRPWLQDFVVSSSILTDDPNRDLLVTV